MIIPKTPKWWSCSDAPRHKLTGQQREIHFTAPLDWGNWDMNVTTRMAVYTVTVHSVNTECSLLLQLTFQTDASSVGGIKTKVRELRCTLWSYIMMFTCSTTHWMSLCLPVMSLIKAPHYVPSVTCDRYKMSLLKPSTKALALSCKVSVRTDSRGFLSLQYLVRNDDGQICFVEYYCCPDEEVEEEWLQSFNFHFKWEP